MANKLLLLDDVDSLGRSGDIVSVKPGYARNYLIPQGLARVADRNALRMQAKLQEERAKKAAADRAEAEAIAAKINGKVYEVEVKVDHEGHMYGSVSIADVQRLAEENEGVTLDKHWVQLAHPIKTTGVHTVVLKLKEDVTAEITLKVMSEDGLAALEAAEKSAEVSEEASEEAAE